jgi:60 kDa SS-A/Ro ribonucleoprotein
MKYNSIIKPRPVPQSKPLNTQQVKNNAGGYVYQIDLMQQLQRFLVLGSDKGSYYVGAHKLTKDNLSSLDNAVKAHGHEAVVDLIADYS